MQTHCVAVRVRPWKGDATRCMREVLLVGSGGDGTLGFPRALPPRFATRAAAAAPPLVLRDGSRVSVWRVASSGAFDVPPHRSRASLLTDGLWVGDSDLEPKGACDDDDDASDDARVGGGSGAGGGSGSGGGGGGGSGKRVKRGVPARVTVCGLAVAPSASAAWAAVRDVPTTPRGTVVPLAVYHGCDAAVVPCIQRHGLATSHGMLGRAAYVGTWWKATRYAARDAATYAWRTEGAVVRLYLLPRRGVAEFDGRGTPCPCAACEATRARTAAAAATRGWSPQYDGERTRIADHGGAWQRGADVAHVGVVRCHDGGSRRVLWASRNDEWAVADPAAACELACVVTLDLRSMAAPHWDPLQRDQTIL